MNRSSFVTRVESMRGLAALMVALGHSFIVFQVNGIANVWDRSLAELTGFQAITTRFFIIIFNGGAAVSMFFVISGFVLGLSLDHHRGPFLNETLRFVLRRFFRIYPALLVSGFAITVFLVFHSDHSTYPWASQWFNAHYRETLSSESILKNILLIETSINPVTWTLRVEMLAAFLLPVFHLINRRIASSCADVTTLAALIAIAYWGQRYETPRFLFMFYLGLALPTIGLLMKRLERKGSFPSICGLIVAVILLLYARTGIDHPITMIMLEGFAATWVLAGLVYGQTSVLFNFLDHYALRFLGKISYSFYLYHFIVLYIFSAWMLQTVPLTAIQHWPLALEMALACSSIGVAMTVAFFSHRYIELPFINIGKRIGTKYSPLSHATCS